MNLIGILIYVKIAVLISVWVNVTFTARDIKTPIAGCNFFEN